MTAEQALTNPLSPYAITVEDLEVGRAVTRFNLYYGIIGRFQVLSPPTKIISGVYDLTSTVRMRNLGNRNDLLRDDNHHLSDMGIFPYLESEDSWHGANFTILTENEVHLPIPLGVLADPSAELGEESE